MSSPVQVGVFGKHPERGDFVRWGARGELCAGFEAWVGAEQARASGRVAPAPERAIRFAVKRGGCPRLLTGCWIESCDAVGRHFPLIGYAEVEVEEAVPPELVPMAAARFDEEMEALLRDASASRLSADVQAIQPPCEDEWSIAAARLGRDLRALTVRGWGERVFGGSAALVPSAIDSATKLAEAVRRSAGRPLSARFVGADLRDIALWMGVFCQVAVSEAMAWVALWEPRGDVCVLGLGELQADLVATLRPARGFRTRAWRFDPAYVQDLGAEARAFLDRPLAEVLAVSSSRWAAVRDGGGCAKR